MDKARLEFCHSIVIQKRFGFFCSCSRTCLHTTIGEDEIRVRLRNSSVSGCRPVPVSKASSCGVHLIASLGRQAMRCSDHVEAAVQ